jgi:hypothetical protein
MAPGIYPRALTYPPSLLEFTWIQMCVGGPSVNSLPNSYQPIYLTILLPFAMPLTIELEAENNSIIISNPFGGSLANSALHRLDKFSRKIIGAQTATASSFFHAAVIQAKQSSLAAIGGKA